MNNKNFQASNFKLIQAIALGALALVGNLAYAADYTFSDLGTAGGPYSENYAINNSNQSTGVNSRGTPSQDQGWVVTRWNGATMNLISDPGRFNAGWAINSSGEIAGGSSRAFVGYLHAAVWNGDTRTDLNDLGGATDPNDNRWSQASGINDKGQIIGASVTQDQSAYLTVLWNNSVNPTVLSTLGGTNGEGNGINNSGMAVGDSNTTGDLATHAALWDVNSSTLSDLGTLGGTNSSALAINASGEIVGWSNITGDASTHATVWNGATMTDLGTLGGLNSQALGLNSAGAIVGYSEIAGDSKHASLWLGGALTDLNSLVAASVSDSGWVLNQAYGINDQGYIVGTASNSLLGISRRAFLLSPAAVPVPAAVWLFGSALAGFMGMNRRKQTVAA